MSIESDLKKNGITVIEPLDRGSIETIAKSVSTEIVSAFSNFGFTFDSLYERFSIYLCMLQICLRGLQKQVIFIRTLLFILEMEWDFVN